MRIKFEWRIRNGTAVPTCSAPEDGPGFNALTSILTDDGGQGWRSLRGWPAEGVRRVADVAEGRLSRTDWVSDSWAADILPGWVRVYSLLDEDDAIRLSLADFSVVLLAWDRFLTAGPAEATIDTLEVTELGPGVEDSQH